MEVKSYKPILNLFPIALLLYLLHKGLLYWLGIDTATFHYSLELLYLFFLSSSLILLFILIRVKAKNADQFGMAFIWITGVKILLCGLMIIPFLPRSAEHKSLERINFFMIFILFLAIETIMSVRIINNKQ